MMEILPSLLFNRYKFTEADVRVLHDILDNPIFRAYIEHTVSGEVQQHILTPITALQAVDSLRDNEMFTKGVVQLGTALLDRDNITALLRQEI